MGNAKKLKPRDLAKAGMARCPVPTCGRIYKPRPEQTTVPPTAPPVCPACEEFVARLMYWLPKIKIENKATTKGGIVLPGSAGYQAAIDGVKKP